MTRADSNAKASFTKAFRLGRRGADYDLGGEVGLDHYQVCKTLLASHGSLYHPEQLVLHSRPSPLT